MKSNKAVAYRLEIALKKQIMDKLEDFVLREGLWMKKVDIIMSARQMNVHYIYIIFVRVTEIEVVMYL